MSYECLFVSIEVFCYSVKHPYGIEDKNVRVFLTAIVFYVAISKESKKKNRRTETRKEIIDNNYISEENRTLNSLESSYKMNFELGTCSFREYFCIYWSDFKTLTV